MTNKIYAQIKIGTNFVENVIIADSTFSITGYELIAVSSGVCCEPNSYYNRNDSLFYEDSSFEYLAGTKEQESS